MARTRERERTITVLSIVATLIVVGGYVTFSNSPLSVQARSLVGLDDRLRPAVTADADGAYAFLATHPDGRPVGFNPCQEIEYVVNPSGAPGDWEQLVETAIGELSDATGLGFSSGGTTDDRAFSERIDRFNDPLPVIIAWADDQEVDALADDVAGVGGPTQVRLGPQRSYVSGSVVMDTDITDRLDRQIGGSNAQLGLLLHELGHLVGLDHVDDPEELMFPSSTNMTSFGAGDLQGLALLGAIPCR
ncbi:MAG: matrixin family metalloprotease [Nocardioides sp.]